MRAARHSQARRLAEEDIFCKGYISKANIINTKDARTGRDSKPAKKDRNAEPAKRESYLTSLFHDFLFYKEPLYGWACGACID